VGGEYIPPIDPFIHNIQLLVPLLSYRILPIETATMVHPDVDETPLSAAQLERRNSLEKHLQCRPDQQDLKERHILLDTNVSP
jgi:RPEL repeat.